MLTFSHSVLTQSTWYIDMCLPQIDDPQLLRQFRFHKIQHSTFSLSWSSWSVNVCPSGSNHPNSLRLFELREFQTPTHLFLPKWFHLKTTDFLHASLWIWQSRCSLPMSTSFWSAKPLSFLVFFHAFSATDDYDLLRSSGFQEFFTLHTQNPLNLGEIKHRSHRLLGGKEWNPKLPGGQGERDETV
jgi:hypothetical protein